MKRKESKEQRWANRQRRWYICDRFISIKVCSTASMMTMFYSRQNENKNSNHYEFFFFYSSENRFQVDSRIHRNWWASMCVCLVSVPVTIICVWMCMCVGLSVYVVIFLFGGEFLYSPLNVIAAISSLPLIFKALKCSYDGLQENHILLLGLWESFSCEAIDVNAYTET